MPRTNGEMRRSSLKSTRPVLRNRSVEIIRVNVQRDAAVCLIVRAKILMQSFMRIPESVWYDRITIDRGLAIPATDPDGIRVVESGRVVPGDQVAEIAGVN